MRFLKLLVTILVLLLLFIAAWQNIPPILEKDITLQLDLYWWSWQSKPIPIYLIIPLCFFAGMLLTGLVNFGTIFRLRHKVRALEKELRTYGPPAPAPYTPTVAETEVSASDQA